MRKVLIGLFLLCFLVAIPVAAQDDAVCPAQVSEMLETVTENCDGIQADQICYGSGVVEAIPRYLTADFEFDAPGALLDIERMETVQLFPTEDGTYSASSIELRGDLPDEVSPNIQLFAFGDVFLANNVIPAIELEMTTTTLTVLRTEPSDFSGEVATLLPGELVTATGRVGELEPTESDWVRVATDDGFGWLTAGILEEDYLLPSLPLVEPDEPFLGPMQSLTLLSAITDRACEQAPDSGLLIQGPRARTHLRINGLELDFKPTSTVYVQAQAGAAMDVYVLQGGVTAGEVNINGGQVARYPMSIDAVVSQFDSGPVAYANAKVQPLLLLADVLDSELLIVRGDDAEVELPPVVADAPSTEEPAEEIAELPTQETAEAVEPVEEIEESPTEEAVAAVVTAEAVEPVEEVAELPTEEAVEEVTTAASGESSALAEEIRQRGVIRVGVNGSLPTFSMEEGDDFVGFEPALAREIVNRLFGEGFPIEWVQVSARQRESALAEGQIDLMVRNTAFAPEREGWGEWTNTFYFIDGQRFLVRTDSGIMDLPGLSGRSIGVQASTPAQTVLDNIAGDIGMTVVPLQGTLIELLNTLSNGEVDAISADWTALESIRQTANNPQDYVIIGDPVTEIPWSAATPPGRTAFRDEVDDALLMIIQDGTWLSIYDEWFPTPLPSSLEMIFASGEAIASAPVEEADAIEATPVPAEPIEPVEAEEVPTEPPAVEEEPPIELEEAQPAPTETPIPENAPPITGELTITIFTAVSQQRTMRITPDPDGTFLVELIRNGRIVYEARYQYYESTDRYENVRSSFEYIEFSDTAGDTSLGCGREPDITGFFNGAAFEGKVGC